MSRHAPALAISSLIAPDALSSPLADAHQVPWDAHLQPTGMLYSPTHPPLYDLHGQSHPFALFPSQAFAMQSPPQPCMNIASPMPTAAKGLRCSRMGTPSADAEQTLCLPTHQVFDIPPGGFSAPSPSPSPAPAPEQPRERLSISINPSLAVPAKRPSGSIASASKKARSSTSTRDFVPPDVSGLSKREARLVKNRAAAFLSRQRKREEFENMEVRVAELEQENARLLALAQQHAGRQHDDELVSEVSQLRQQLVDMEARERALAEELSRKAASAAGRSPSPTPSAASSIKSEFSEPSLRSAKGEKSGASLGLMVLLCALPTLLSMPSQQSALPQTLPLSFTHASSGLASSALDMHSFLQSGPELDWSLGGVGADTDLSFDFELGSSDERSRIASAAAAALSMSNRRLEFVGDEGAPLADLGALDISFDAEPAENGKIRVRIHPQSGPSSASSVSSASSAGSPPASTSDDSDAMSLWGEPDPDAEALGPFLGMPEDAPATGLDYFDFERGSASLSRAGSPGASARRRVRIALRSMPGKGREGGEWEVELC